MDKMEKRVIAVADIHPDCTNQFEARAEALIQEFAERNHTVAFSLSKTLEKDYLVYATPLEEASQSNVRQSCAEFIERMSTLLPKNDFKLIPSPTKGKA